MPEAAEFQHRGGPSPQRTRRATRVPNASGRGNRRSHSARRCRHYHRLERQQSLTVAISEESHHDELSTTFSINLGRAELVRLSAICEM
jgi:hypothetical protein